MAALDETLEPLCSGEMMCNNTVGNFTCVCPPGTELYNGTCRESMSDIVLAIASRLSHVTCIYRLVIVGNVVHETNQNIVCDFLSNCVAKP